ncbi:phosphoadenosine phosphosulfate reductase family protein [Oleidesulfovibrio sp.]|uniref:phosphoadenosine phosphosulfate reductase domain-containing protein n=1 Tax=Oleidesulfovibrio sp. TaxID=2909707 RepID=UPI003A8AEBD0
MSGYKTALQVTPCYLKEHNITLVASVSGGKDSTATILQLKEWEVPFIPVFADTGNEHEATLEYVDKLPQMTGCPPIIKVKADFASRFAGKRKFIANDTRCPNQTGRRRGWSTQAKERALRHLQPTGIPFLDLCMLKGRFPSRRAQFCTRELKQIPIYEQVQEPLINEGKSVWSVQGIRWEESPNRAGLPYLDADRAIDDRMYHFRPILHWTVEDVFTIHRRHAVAPNPLYKQGMTRVGCLPCINAKKDEVFEIARRWPHHIDRIRTWEKTVGMCSKRMQSTFFASGFLPYGDLIPNIDDVVQWSATMRGGLQFDLMKLLPPAVCASVYGLCE